jgi:predicted DNA-binding transcriptional regulator AlpA
MPRTTKTPPARHLTLADIQNLPAMLDIPTAGELLGISRATAYRLAAADALPVPVVPVGHSLRIPAAPLLALIGLAPVPVPGTATAADSGGNAPDTPDTADPA